MIDWTKYFDKIVCINYCQFKKRKELMQTELKRVGILDSGIFEWQFTFSGPYEQHFTDLLTLYTKMNWGVNRVSCMLGHYKAIRKAYYSGCENVLIIEDDQRFLKDLNKLEDLLNNIPNDQFDVLLLDKFVMNYQEYTSIISNPNNIINKYYCPFHKMLSAGCYVLNRTGMELILSLYDSNNFKIVDMFFPVEQLEPYWRKLCAITPAAVQVTFTKAASSMLCFNQTEEGKSGSALNFQLFYRRQGINFDDYMMRVDGSEYKYGDFIEQ